MDKDAKFVASMRMADDTIRSVTEAVDLFAKLPRVAGQVSVFRGQAKFDWKLTPPIDRAPERLRERENELVRELVAVAPDKFAGDVSMFDRLVRMQHFGLPTRLLDTTANPLVALYFATEELDDLSDGTVVILDVNRDSQKYFDSDTVSCISNLSNLTQDERLLIEDTKARAIADFNALHAVDRLVQFIHAEKPSFRPRVQRLDLFRRLHVIPKMNNPRIVAQSGSFILFGLDRHKIGAKVQIKPRRLRVPSDCKEQIRRGLAGLGITESTLFPELDRAASNIVQRINERP